MSQREAKQTRKAVRSVVGAVARDAMADMEADILSIRGVLYRGFWGRLRWLVLGR